MAGGILDVAVSGLNAFQRSLATTSHNIASANNEGYSRQRVELATNPAQYMNGGYVGKGVNVSNITRSYDEFINNQLRSGTAAYGDINRFHELTSQIDNILADPGAGMGPTIKDFFNALNEVADDPGSIPARQVLLSESQILTERFHTMNSRYDELRGQINQDMKLIVNDVNSLATSLADLNKQISNEIGRSGGNQLPNDLLDERDKLLVNLSGKVDVTVIEEKNGILNVFIGQGQPLVMGARANQLTTKMDPLDPAQLQIGFGAQDITKQLTGGEISGTLRFRDEVLEPTQQKLGRIAAGLAMEVNAIHGNGYDLNGNKAADFFTFGTPEVTVKSSPTTSGSITVNLQDVNLNPSASGALDFSDYRLDVGGVSPALSYTLTRLSDKSTINLSLSGGQLVATSPETLPGIEISASGLASNDSFIIQPTKNAAGRIELNLTDPRKVAAATNVETDPVTGEPVLVGGNPVIIRGPMPGDNRNALALANLENKQGMLGGTATFLDSYGQIVSEVGTLTHASDVNSKAQEVLLNQTKEARESLAGVNLDEEAANLVKFQQSYQAAAQLVSVTNSLFDSIIGAVRR